MKRKSPLRRRQRTTPTPRPGQEFYSLASKSHPFANTGFLLADPERAKAPQLTTDRGEAYHFATRSGAYRYLGRKPGMARRFKVQRVS